MTSESMGNRSQSFEHMRMKLFFYENIPLSNKIIRIEEEYKMQDQIIDVYVELANGNKIAIELQHSKISDTKLLERTLNYNKQGIYVLWVLNGNSFNRAPHDQDEIRVSKLESQLHKIYNGRVYYINMQSKGVISGVYTLSYVPYFNIKDVIYKKKATSKRCVYCQEIKTFELKCISGKYKLAMFEDVNIKTRCETDIYQLLRKCCKDKFKEELPNKPKTLIIPVIKIVSLLQDKYGFYLVYDALKTSKNKLNKLKIARLGFMKDTEEKIRESIKIYISDYIDSHKR